MNEKTETDTWNVKREYPLSLWLDVDYSFLPFYISDNFTNYVLPCQK